MTIPPSRLTPEAIAHAFHGIEQTDNIQEEQPYHRHAAYLFAMGGDTREVADALGVTTHSVRSWLREGWFQERVSLIMKEHGGKDLTQLFINEGFSTLSTMLELRDNVKTPPAVRRGICSDILDRGFGKPKVYVETSAVKPSDDPVAEAERLEAANRKMLNNN